MAFDDLPSGEIPRLPRVYVVIREGQGPPEFLDSSPAGWFKGRNPTAVRAKLDRAWIPDVPVVYIGKASNLRTRVDQYRRHGVGEPVGHWGGRYIWQLDGAAPLLVGWRETSGLDPECAKAGLLEEFLRDFGALPFANLKRGRPAATSGCKPDSVDRFLDALRWPLPSP